MFAERLSAAIDGARTLSRLDRLSHIIWQGYAAGAVSDDGAQSLAEQLSARKSNVRGTIKPIGIPPGRQSIFPVRKAQIPPDRKASISRRRALAASGPLPPRLAARFTIGQLAVLRVVGDEVRDRGACSITIAEIAARAGVSRSMVQSAIREAAAIGLVTVQERRRQGEKNLPNVVRIVSREWVAWIKRGPKSSPLSVRAQPQPGGFKFSNPTDTTNKKGSSNLGRDDRSRPKWTPARSQTRSIDSVSLNDTLRRHG